GSSRHALHRGAERDVRRSGDGDLQQPCARRDEGATAQEHAEGFHATALIEHKYLCRPLRIIQCTTHTHDARARSRSCCCSAYCSSTQARKPAAMQARRLVKRERNARTARRNVRASCCSSSWISSATIISNASAICSSPTGCGACCATARLGRTRTSITCRPTPRPVTLR